jgi:hypothetical protein
VAVGKPVVNTADAPPICPAVSVYLIVMIELAITVFDGVQ